MITQRIPRPKGYTELAHLHNKGNTDITQSHLDNHIIQSYIATDFRYCGTHMDIPTLSRLTGIATSTITQAIVAYGKDVYSQADPNDQGDLLRALIGMALEGTLADRQKALEQYAVLRASQGSGYKAFVTSEVNKALKLTMESTGAVMQLYKTMAGQSGLAVVINNQATETTNNYLTTETALELIKQNSNEAPLLEDPESKEALFIEHNIEGMPEVNANKQQGIDISREGHSLTKIANVSESLVGDDKHRDRRAKELGIDLESDEV